VKIGYSAGVEMFATNACTVDVYSDAYQYESYGQSGGDQAGYGSYG